MTIVIGLTGSFGSGCSCISKEFIEKKDYNKISLSTILKEIYVEEEGTEPPSERNKLQEYGNKIRKEKGNSHLVEKAVEKIDSESCNKWVIDSIKNPHEIEYLKNKFPEFYLISVFANFETRWSRVEIPAIYDGNKKLFREDDKRDKDEIEEYGQKVEDCCSKADIIISNDKQFSVGNRDYKKLEKKVNKFLRIIEGNETYFPTTEEAFMVMAYANSLRSSCLKRKVGAIIIDDDGNLYSSGYNEVPISLSPCKSEHAGCFRDKKREKFNRSIKDIENDEHKQEQILEKFKSCKILDYCRALHAEETAILNLAKSGNSTMNRGATLYTTTYPCNLCANKIVQVGIKNVVYLEPYPMLEAKSILKENNVKDEAFEGVTFNGYFRLGGK